MRRQPLLVLLLAVLLAIALPVLVAVPPPASRFNRLGAAIGTGLGSLCKAPIQSLAELQEGTWRYNTPGDTIPSPVRALQLGRRQACSSRRDRHHETSGRYGGQSNGGTCQRVAVSDKLEKTLIRQNPTLVKRVR